MLVFADPARETRRRSIDLSDSDGAWIRGVVVRNGRPVADAEIRAVLVSESDDPYARVASTRSATDGSFALFVPPEVQDLSSAMLLTATHVGELGSLEIAEVGPGDRIGGLTIDMTP